MEESQVNILHPNLKKWGHRWHQAGENLISPRDITGAFTKFLIDTSVDIANSIQSDKDPLEYISNDVQSSLIPHSSSCEGISTPVKELKSTA